MNNELKAWKKESLGFEVRTKDIEGEPWFVLADICKCLEIGNPSDVVCRLKSKGVVKIEGVVNSGLGDQVVEINLINEANLYRCVLRSNKKEAVIFQDWVVEEVLPSIRKTGSYGSPKSYGEALIEAGKLQLEKEKLEAERDEAIRTKAWISDKKTATAMVTASHLSREVNKLREEVGFNKEYATVKKVEIHTKRKFRWKPLKDYSKTYELEIKKVSDVNYGTVNCYHADAWYNCYDIDLETFFK